MAVAKLLHKMYVLILAIASAFESVYAQDCSIVYAQGITQAGANEVVNIHNKLRLSIAKGLVPGEPRGTNLNRLDYDNDLGVEAQVVSNQCQMKHVTIEDERFWWVGQNLYISWSSVNTPGQNWTQAVMAWFNEYKDFTFPNIAKPGKMVGHYTQVVWADSYLVGCDFINFYDVTQPDYPYAKLYTCNYGPGGNIVGQNPYATSGNSCPNLC